jgi:hypothetical protein
MRHAKILVATFVVALASAEAQLFTPGDLIVTTYGSPSSTITDGAPTPITLNEFSTAGGAVLLSFTLPTSDGVGGSNNVGVVGEYGSSSEGNIQLSGNGQYLTLAGYSATQSYAGNYSVNTTALAQSSSTSVPRVAILVDGNGNVNSSTVLNDIYNTNNPRAVYSSDGSSIYISGQGDKTAAQQGIFLAPTGLNTTSGGSPTGIYNANDTRYVTANNGNLTYSLDKKGSPTGIFQYNGLPSNASATATQLTAASNGQTGAAKVSYSPEGFFFANPTTLYVADTGVPKAGGIGDGGIQKWTLNNGSWSLQYTLTPSGFVAPASAATATSGETGFEAITGAVDRFGNVSLYAVSYTAGDDNPNGLYKITDALSSTDGSGETFTELESAAGNGGAVFKGVSFAPVAVPEPSVTALLAVASGVGFVCLRRRRRR